MQHQCFQLAATLTESEWRRFLAHARLVASQFSHDLAPLVEAVQAGHPSFDMGDEVLWAKAYPGREFNDARLRILRSYLKNMLEDFIVSRELEEDVAGKQLLLAKALLRREGLPSAERLLARVRRELPQPAMKLHTWEHAQLLEELTLDLAAQQLRVGPDYRWDTLLDQVRAVALTKQLRLLAAIAGTNGFQANKSAKVVLAQQEVLESVDGELLHREPLAAIFFNLLQLLLGKSVGHSPVLGLLATHAMEMSSVERLNIYGLLINHYFEQQRQRVPGSLATVFEIFQEMHRQDLIFGLGASTESTIRTIIQVGIRLQEMDWLRGFLNEVHERLPKADRERMYRYGTALLDFGEGKFLEAKRHLAHLEITSSAERLYHDNLYMRICYETHDRDGLEVISSVLLRHLYRKEQIAESTKRAAINLAKAVMALFDLRWSPAPKMDLEQVRAYIDTLQPISHLDWIQAKLSEFGTEEQKQPAHTHGPVED